MGKKKRRFVAMAIRGKGWRIWDITLHTWWGQHYANCPDALLEELNGAKRSDALTELQRQAPITRHWR